MIDEKAGEEDDEEDDNNTTPEESSSSTETQQQPNAVTDGAVAAPPASDEVKPTEDVTAKYDNDDTKGSDGCVTLSSHQHDTSSANATGSGSSVTVKIEQQQLKMESDETNGGCVDGAKPPPSLPEQQPVVTDDKKDAIAIVKSDVKLENYDDINKRQIKIVATDTQQGQQQQQAPIISIIKSSNPSDTKGGGDGANVLRLADSAPQLPPTQSSVQLVHGNSAPASSLAVAASYTQSQLQAMAVKQQPPNIVVVKTEEEKQGRQQQHQQQQQQQQQHHPQGTSKIIIHDPNSLNKLFPPTGPAHQYQQYSPTLSNNINPQKLNEGMNDAFSSKNAPPSNIQQQPPLGNNMSSLVISRPEDGGSTPNSNKISSVGSILPPAAAINILPVPKATLSSKPSLEIKQVPNANFDMMHSPAKVLTYSEYFPKQSPSAVAAAVSHYHTPSVEIQQQQSRAGHVMSPRDMKMEEKVEDSDTETEVGEDQGRSSNSDDIKSSAVSPPGTVLTLVHEIYPQKDADRAAIPAIITSPPIVEASVHHHQQLQQQQLLVSGTNPFKLSTIHTTLATIPPAALSLRPLGAQQQLQQGQKGFENALLSRDLSSKLSSEAANFNLFQGKRQPPLQQPQQQNGRVIDHNKSLINVSSPHYQATLRSGIGDNKTGQPTSLTLLPAAGVDHHRNNQSSMEGKSNILNISSNNNPNNGPTGVGSEVTKTTSLLHQRLLSPDTSILNNQPGGVKLPPAKAPQFHPGGDRGVGVGGEYRLNAADKLSVTTSLTLTSSVPRVPEKSKLGLPGAGGLRINPPPEERANARMSSHPEGPNSQYRAPLTKGLSMSEIQPFPALSIPPSSSGASGIDNQRKMLLSRTTSNIAIAPAPSTVISSRGAEMTATGSAVDYVHGAEGN